jgi:hypothetical protein
MKELARKNVFRVFGWIEVLIGMTALIGSFAAQMGFIPGHAGKPDNIYVFVVVTAAVSFVLGVGLLYDREWARKLLIFFAGYIILTKVLIASGLMSFSGVMLTAVSPAIRDMVSGVYHAALLIALMFCSHDREDNGAC